MQPGVSWYSDIVQFFRNLFGRVIDFFRSILETIVNAISGFFQILINAVLTWLKWAVDIFISYFNLVLQFFLDLVYWIFDLVWQLLVGGWELFFGDTGLCWLPVDWFCDLLDYLLRPLVSGGGVSPDGAVWHSIGGAGGGVSEAMIEAATWNGFLPCFELLVQGMIFFSFVVTFLIVKAVLKLIPTVG